MSDKDKSDKNDSVFFPNAVGGVRPLKQDRVTPPRKKRRPVPEQTLRDQHEVLASLLSDEYEPSEIETGDELFYARPGLQHGILRKLRRGQYSIEAQLDLHGDTVPEAREHMSVFLRDMQARNKRCVRIIHGKGKSSEGRLPVY